MEAKFHALSKQESQLSWKTVSRALHAFGQAVGVLIFIRGIGKDQSSHLVGVTCSKHSHVEAAYRMSHQKVGRRNAGGMQQLVQVFSGIRLAVRGPGEGSLHPYPARSYQQERVSLETSRSTNTQP